MSELLVLVVGDPRTAEEMVDALSEMPDSGALLRDVAWVERRANGKVRMHQDAALVGAGTVADMGIVDDWIRDVGESLEPGKAAVLLLVDEKRVDDVLAAVERFHPEVKRATLARTGSEAEFRKQLEERFPATTAA